MDTSYPSFHTTRPGQVQMNRDASTELRQPPSSSPPPDHAQAHRRIFLGPMPYSVSGTDSHENAATDFVSQHGLRIFLEQGGRIEEWTEAKAREYKERLKQRILESAAWHTVSSGRTKRKGMIPGVEWRGDTFEIGKVAGVNVNMLATPEGTMPALQDMRRSSDRSTARSRSAVTVHWDNPSRTSFVTARSTLTGIASPNSESLPPILSNNSDSNGEGNDLLESNSSRTPLVSDVASHSIPRVDPVHASKLRGAKSEGDLSKKARAGLKSILTGPGKDKGKSKAVRYAEVPRNGIPGGSECPAPPHEVLQRSPSEVEDSSAAAAAEAVASEACVNAPGGVGGSSSAVQRDRMLVRVFRCEHEGLKYPFVDRDCRATRGLYSKEWSEFLVMWRKRRIELYEDYRVPRKERILGHKHLAFVIPLTSLRTKLSLFSLIDMSFCLICAPTPTKSKEDRGSRSLFHRSPRGLNVFVFKHKSRSRALDWIWNLWMELGGSLPHHIEVNCPLVHARVSMPIPDAGAGWKSVTRDYVIDQCSKAMERSFEWQTVIQLPILNGRQLELCWRSGTKLDWVWLKDDVEGNRRDWEVLFGTAVNILGGPSQLELHLASHYSTRAGIANGKYLEEPPSVEGYVHSYKRKSQTRVQYYLSTHDGYLFVVHVEKVVTPPTPTDFESFAKSEREFREDENIRLRTQIVNSRWFWDLRNVLLVRQAIHVVHRVRDASIAASQTAEPSGLSFGAVAQNQEHQNEGPVLHRTESDIGDEGGESGLASSADKPRLKMYRSFEVVLKNGRILRFEAHSTKVAVEWVTHLRALVQYWTKRYRHDTANEMMLKDSLGEDRITVSKRYKNGTRHPVSASNAENATLHMDELWHWCVLDGCRQIVKSGQVYMKQKFRAQYRHVHLVLTRGCLVQFTVKKDFSLHNRQFGRINLLDAYVCSGYYAAIALPTEEYDPNAFPSAKYFSDGLETRDLAEDMLFMLWYRPHADDTKGDNDKIPIPQMSSKRKVAIFRARSKLERDAWCWALSCEIERLVRRSMDREQRMREQGMPV